MQSVLRPRRIYIEQADGDLDAENQIGQVLSGGVMQKTGVVLSDNLLGPHDLDGAYGLFLG